MFKIIKIFNPLKLISTLFIIVIFSSGCLNSEPPPPPGQQIETSADQKKEDISQDKTNEFVNDTGMVIDDITIKPKGSLGGDVIITVENTSQEECGGFVLNADLVTETKEVVVTLGLVADKGIPAGEKETLSEMFIGKGVTEIVVTAITCEFKRLGNE